MRKVETILTDKLAVASIVHSHYPVKLLLCAPESIVEAVKACEEAKMDSRIIVLMKGELI